MSLLDISISADYRGQRDVLRSAAFDLDRGEILGLVGQSGAGKSTIALAILRLLEYRGGSVRGRIEFQGRDLMPLPEREMRRVRGREIALVPQSPIAALNPALRIGTQMAEAWKVHARTAIAPEELIRLLETVSIPADERFLRKYPRELSVGLAQRVLIAMAILHRPPLIIADEPTSALDMLTQSEILSLFAELNRELNTAILYISHDLVSVASICHRVAILHAGEIVETGSTADIFQSPAHSYTRKLVGSALTLADRRLEPSTGLESHTR